MSRSPGCSWVARSLPRTPAPVSLCRSPSSAGMNEAPTGWLAPSKWSGGDLGFPPLNAKANSPFHPLGDSLRTQSQGLILVSAHRVALRARPPGGHQEERETMQGPQSWGAPPPQLPQEMRENRKNQPEGWRSPLLRCPFQTPLSPFAQPLTKSLDPRPRGCAVNQLPGRLTGYHSLQGQPLPAGTREAREGWPPCKLSTLGPRGKEDAQVFPGASRRVHSQAWHPLPGPNHKNNPARS